jgi:hypothetical protein
MNILQQTNVNNSQVIIIIIFKALLLALSRFFWQNK